ncbi:MAG TPA: fumarylacetoacetate hydrolase family protein [Candidatus Tectomicrobia bacterium]|nr:fumarylacetoacetate hydrolase family protein [Candidatus Tectomicrobia bacterium]
MISDADLVTQFAQARAERRAYRPPSAQGRVLDLDEAYRLQDALRGTLLARGGRLAGWKAGFTTAALQQQFGVSEPVCGFLLAGDVFPSGVELPASRFVGLAVEAEVALVLARDLAGPGVTPAHAALAVGGAVAALELVDFRYDGAARGTDIVAEGVYANAVVLGHALTPIAGVDLALEGLVYEHNGVVVATSTAAEVMGNPLVSLAWVANHLGGRGLGLRAGEVVMTGSVSKVLRAKAGDAVRATFTRLGSVSARFA